MRPTFCFPRKKALVCSVFPYVWFQKVKIQENEHTEIFLRLKPNVPNLRYRTYENFLNVFLTDQDLSNWRFKSTRCQTISRTRRAVATIPVKLLIFWDEKCFLAEKHCFF